MATIEAKTLSVEKMIRKHHLLRELCRVPLLSKLIPQLGEQLVGLTDIQMLDLIVDDLLVAYIDDVLMRYADLTEADQTKWISEKLLFLEHSALVECLGQSDATCDYLADHTGIKDRKYWLRSQGEIGFLQFECNKFIHPIFRNYFVARFIADVMGPNPKHNSVLALKFSGHTSVEDLILKDLFMNQQIMMFVKDLVPSIGDMIMNIRFTDDEIKDYFDRNPKLEDDLKFLKKSPMVWELCRIPFFLGHISNQMIRLFEMLGMYNDTSIVEMVLNSAVNQYLSAFGLGPRPDDTDDRTSKVPNEILFLEYSAFAEFLDVSTNTDYIETIIGTKFDFRIQRYLGLVSTTHRFVHPILRDYFVARFLVSCMTNTSSHKFGLALKCLGQSDVSIDYFVSRYIKEARTYSYTKAYFKHVNKVLIYMKELTMWKDRELHERLL
jgi:hypothetical protein